MFFVNLSVRYLRPVPGTVYYIYWDNEDDRWGGLSQQQPGASSSSVVAAAAAAAGAPTPSAIDGTVLTTTADFLTPSTPAREGDDAVARPIVRHGGITPDNRNGGEHQFRSNSLSAVADPAVVVAAAAVATSAAPCPLFVRFEVVHDQSVLHDGEDDAEVAASAAAAAAAADGDRGAPGKAPPDGGAAGGGGSASNSSPASDAPRQKRRQQRRRSQNRGCVVDASNPFSRALKATDVAYSPDGRRPFDRILEERRLDVGGRGADGSGLSGPQSRLCMFATTFPTAEWSRSVINGVEHGGGGALVVSSGAGLSTPPSAYSPVQVKEMPRSVAFFVSCVPFYVIVSPSGG